ncbi:hypothetical protein TNCV_4526691 [Trichonephila clavipes]|nr:hypothetical protein TNCV_4526691 [Trichonephila clavipes]
MATVSTQIASICVEKTINQSIRYGMGNNLVQENNKQGTIPCSSWYTVAFLQSHAMINPSDIHFDNRFPNHQQVNDAESLKRSRNVDC